MIDAIKELIKKIIDFFNKIPPFLIKMLVLTVIVIICIIIVVITINASFSEKIVGTCIEADEFGTKNNRILAQPKKDSDYMINNSYKHEEIRQKIVHTDLGLSLNGEPLTINITGQWIPWLYDYKEHNKTEYIFNSSVLENGGMPDKNFFCALEKYNLIKDAGVDFSVSNKVDENEFYYIKNYYKSIVKYKNKESSDVSIKTPSGNITVAPGKTIVYGEEEIPERQKECWVTRGAGLYLGSYGVNGRTQPRAYHHLIASKMMCSKQYWFGGKINLDTDTITKYRQPIEVNYNKCVCSDNKTRKCDTNNGDLKNEDLGTCSIYTADNTNYKNSNITIECDCKQYENKEYTYANFKENYFDVNYHLNIPLTDQSEILINKQIIDSSGSQIIYNIDLHEKLLYAKGVQNVGYIVASSMEKFTNACYKLQKNIDGNIERNYKSYFQYGPKYIYKNFNSENVKYSYGEKIKMFIADKYYKDNDGFYNIDIISGIDLDSVGSFESKLQEVEFFLLGTPNPGKDDDRADGIIAMIFNNILNSNFVDIARIIMVFMVVILGFKIIFGFAKQDLEKTNLIKLLIKIVVLSVLLSPDAFQFFNKYVINFFINGTIGLIDLSAKIFSNSFMESETSLIGGLQYANTTGSLSRNYAIIDEILAFFEGYAVTAKALSFFFAVGEKFLVGWFVSTAIFLVLIFYVAKLLHSIVPFIFTLLQLTLVLPMAPICLALSLIKQTEGYLKQWLSNVLSKCLQLVSFFIAFYFCTSIINNFIKSLLNFKVCFIPLGEYLMPSVDSSVNVTGVTDFFEMNWLQEFVKMVLNNFTAARFEGLPNNWFIYYCINIAIVTALVYLFDTITNTIMSIVGKMLNIGDASGSDGALSKTENFGLRAQASKFAEISGLTNLQKESKLLSWTRNVVDLSEKDIIGGNLKNIAQKVGKTANQFGNIVGENIYKRTQGQETNFINDMKKLTGKAIDNVIGGDKAKGSIFDAKTWGAEGSRLDYNSWGENKHNDDLINRYITNPAKEKWKNRSKAIEKQLKNDQKQKKQESDSWANRAKAWIDDPNNYVTNKYAKLSDDERDDKIAYVLKLTKSNKTKLSKTEIKNNLDKLKIGKIFGTDTEKLMQTVLQLNNKGLLDDENTNSIIKSLSNKLKDSNDNIKTITNAIQLNEELKKIIAQSIINTKQYKDNINKIATEIYNNNKLVLEKQENNKTNTKEENETDTTENNSKDDINTDKSEAILTIIENDGTKLIQENSEFMIEEYTTDLLDEQSVLIIDSINKDAKQQVHNKIKETISKKTTKTNTTDTDNNEQTVEEK